MVRSREKEDSVYDFLYVDAKRISLLLSQFGTDGVVTELSRVTEENSETSGEVNIQIVKFGGKDGEKSAINRRFDPQWLVPLIFLKEIKDLIVRELTKARIGQFVLVSGELSISDLGILKQLWGIPHFQDIATAGMTQSLDPKDRKSAIASFKKMFSIIEVLPHGTRAELIDKGHRSIWAPMRDNFLVVSSSDLLLNHGSIVAGEWSIIGILDALPDGIGAQNDGTSSMFGGPLGQFMGVFGPKIRELLGRPQGSYGVTPLIIMREIK